MIPKASLVVTLLPLQPMTPKKVALMRQQTGNKSQPAKTYNQARRGALGTMAKLNTWLFIESEDESVDSMSRFIGVECNSWWKKGDPRGRTGKVYKILHGVFVLGTN